MLAWYDFNDTNGWRGLICSWLDNSQRRGMVRGKVTCPETVMRRCTLCISAKATANFIQRNLGSAEVRDSSAHIHIPVLWGYPGCL